MIRTFMALLQHRRMVWWAPPSVHSTSMQFKTPSEGSLRNRQPAAARGFLYCQTRFLSHDLVNASMTRRHFRIPSSTSLGHIRSWTQQYRTRMKSPFSTRGTLCSLDLWSINSVSILLEWIWTTRFTTLAQVS